MTLDVSDRQCAPRINPESSLHPILVCFIPGIPAPQGSTRAFIRPGMKFPIVTADNPKTKPWRQDVASVALAARTWYADNGIPVAVSVVFSFARPQSHMGAKGVKPSAPVHHTKKPDTDKLLRAVLDALTGIAFADDSQVVVARAEKRFCLSGDMPGAAITITKFY